MDFGMSSNLAICCNNIACIHAKQRNIMKQNIYFNEAIRIEEFRVVSKREDLMFTSFEDTLKLVCKYFNSLYNQILQNQGRIDEEIGKASAANLLCRVWPA